jgi:hypothetical protein
VVLLPEAERVQGTNKRKHICPEGSSIGRRNDLPVQKIFIEIQNSQFGKVKVDRRAVLDRDIQPLPYRNFEKPQSKLFVRCAESLPGGQNVHPRRITRKFLKQALLHKLMQLG